MSSQAAVAPCACGHRVHWHHDTRGCGFHGFRPLGRCECRLSSDAAVEQIVARQVAQALTDLDDRCRQAHGVLFGLSQEADDRESARLVAKSSGIALVRSYIGDELRAPPP